MQPIDKLVETMQITRPDHLPIVAAFCKRIRLVETVNRIVPTGKAVDVGTVVQAMVLDTLSGRSPLYRLTDFFKHQDTQVLLGRPLSPIVFNDTTVGRVMDAIFKGGAGKLFSEVSFQACRRFPLDMSHVHFDTTSVNVWGDYDRCSPDAGMVTEDNLNAIGDNIFITRLPFSCNEADRVVSEAVAQGGWEPVGTLNETPVTWKRPAARYKIAEKTVTLYGQPYRAVVVHSTAHDKRRLKRIERQIRQSDSDLKQVVAEHTKPEYLCRPDALAAAERLRACTSAFHRLDTSVAEKVRYARGRPPENAPRKVASVRWLIDAAVVENTELIEATRRESGCFVLLCNVPTEGTNAKTGAELLRAYKEQYGIERNSSFLKDPLIVNDLFLKKPERIEALGAILLIALLVYRLIEFALRHYVDQHDQYLPGWDNKLTQRPTAFMMSTKFIGLLLVRVGNQCRLSRPLTHVQRRYLQALKLSQSHLINPSLALDYG